METKFYEKYKNAVIEWFDGLSGDEQHEVIAEVTGNTTQRILMFHTTQQNTSQIMNILIVLKRTNGFGNILVGMVGYMMVPHPVLTPMLRS